MRSSPRRPSIAAAVLCLATTLASSRANATNATEFPDNGSEQEGRGGAWIARASDPLAAFYNPAGLAGQPTRLTLQANLSMQHSCFARVKAANDPTYVPDDGNVAPGGSYPRVCNNDGVFPDPQLGLTWRASDKVGVGLLVLGPSAIGNVSWPEFANGAPSPSRYLLIKAQVPYVTPTLGVGWEALDGLRVGASFQAGFAPMLDFANASVADQGFTLMSASPKSNDIFSEVHAVSSVVPGFTLGALWSLLPNLDLAGWYKWSAPIEAKGDVQTASGYFDPSHKQPVVWGDTHVPNCNQPAGAPNLCDGGNNVTLKIPQPMEAKLGLRFHQPRATVASGDRHVRDPIAQDVFDLEANLTWANDSTLDAVHIGIKTTNPNGDGSLPPTSGLPPGVATLPPNVDVPHNFRDVYGVRLGGDWNVLPERLAVRAGAFFESQAANAAYQNIDFDAAWRLGFALGGTYRVALGGKSLDLMVGYGHVFFGTLTNDQQNVGIRAVNGTPCSAGMDPSGPTATCPMTGVQKYRTDWIANLGTITSSLNVINVGASLAF
jgi:long-chain fatty acid transport protein